MSEKSKRYYWLKLPNDWFQNKHVKRLRKIAGGDTYTIIYLKMLLKSLENDGKLYHDGIEDTFEEELALDLDEEVDDIKMVMVFLQKSGLIKIDMTDFDYVLTEVPNMVGSAMTAEHKRELNAERQRRYRERKKLENSMVTEDSNANVTLQRNTEIEIEKEIEIEIENRDKRKELYLNTCSRTRTSNDRNDNYIPPTIEEMHKYILEKKLHVDVYDFNAYFESRGWMVDGHPLWEWKYELVKWSNANERAGR